MIRRSSRNRPARRGLASHAVARAICAFAAIVGVAVSFVPARAAIETDPIALYQRMRKAYDEGSTKSWPFESELYYQSTVFDVGRAYSLFRPDDPQYGEVALLTVDVATQLHYNPLTNNDASLWWVREASVWAEKNADDQHKAEAVALLARADAGENDPKTLARQAEDDALADAATFRRDGDALVQVIVADARAYNLTHDVTYRSALLQHMADPSLPLMRVPDPEATEMLAIASAALTDPTYSATDRQNARIVDYRRKHNPDLQIIGRVVALPHDLRLTRTAPADEYFGNLKMSPIGVHNEIVRINKYLDVGWGYRMAHDGLLLATSIDDWQHQYPHDETLPAQMLDAYKVLKRISVATTDDAAAKLKTTLLVEYSSSKEARALAGS
jgi:hypothetical protein